MKDRYGEVCRVELAGHFVIYARLSLQLRHAVARRDKRQTGGSRAVYPTTNERCQFSLFLLDGTRNSEGRVLSISFERQVQPIQARERHDHVPKEISSGFPVRFRRLFQPSTRFQPKLVYSTSFANDGRTP